MRVKTRSLVLREEQTESVNTVLSRIFGLKGRDIIGGWESNATRKVVI